MKCVVTGGAGFIGSHLVDKLLKEGHGVTVFDDLSSGRIENLGHVLDEIDFVKTDLAQQRDLVENLRDTDWVFHLAALADIVPSIEKPDRYFRSNVDATFNLLEASKEVGVSRFVYVASSSSYGIPDTYPTPEEQPMNPQYPYALTKWLGEELVMHWATVYGLPAVSLRFFNVYGPRSRTTGSYGAVFGVFLAQKLAGHPFTVVGDGTQTRDFTYVSDIVNALIMAAQSERVGRAYNVASGNPVSVNRLVDLLGGEVTYIPKRPGEPDCTHAYISRIKTELGWEPKVSFEVGVRNLLENIEDWATAPVWTPSKIEAATKSWFEYLGGSKP